VVMDGSPRLRRRCGASSCRAFEYLMVLKPIVTWLRAPAASGRARRFEEAIAAYQKWIQR
jgi:hypothetical protein